MEFDLKFSLFKCTWMILLTWLTFINLFFILTTGHIKKKAQIVKNIL